MNRNRNRKTWRGIISGPVLVTSSFLLLGSLWMSGCATDIMDTGESQVQLRSMQTRVFDTGDKKTVVRGVLSTLQDLNFMIDKADADLGTISATRLSHSRVSMNFGEPQGRGQASKVRITVTVRPKSKVQMRVRANLQKNLRPVRDPGSYQQFFFSTE